MTNPLTDPPAPRRLFKWPSLAFVEVEPTASAIVCAPNWHPASSRTIVAAALLAVLVANGSAAGQQMAPQNPQPQPNVAVDSAEGPLVVMGLDLSAAPSVQYRKKVIDIYDPLGREHANIISISLARTERANPATPPAQPISESFSLKYAASVKRFYIEYRSDQNKLETERIYGPFAGDPFDRLRLEPVMIQRLRTKYSPDDLFCIKRMLTTQNNALGQRAMRLAQAAIECTDTPVVEYILGEIRQTLKENVDTIKRLNLQVDAQKLEERMAQIDAKLEKLVAEIPESEYLTPADSKVTLPDSIPKEAWGESVNGLRAAAVPKQDTVALREELPVTLVVENTSDREMKFSCSDLAQSAHADVLDGRHQPTQGSKAWFSGDAPIERFVLKPGEKVALARVSVMVIAEIPQADNSVFGRSVVVDSTRGAAATSNYQMRYTVPLATGSSWRRGEDGVMRRISPAKGEWKGLLTSGFVEFQATAK